MSMIARASTLSIGKTAGLVSVLLAISVCGVAHGQATYTWTQTASGSQAWTTAGNWSGGSGFVSNASNELVFFADTTTALPAGGSQTVTGIPATLSLNTLTLNGKGPNNTNGYLMVIGDGPSTWTIGDGTTSTINLNSTLGGGTRDRDVRYTITADLVLNQTTTTFTGDSTSGTGADFTGTISENAAGYGVTKSGSSLLIFSGTNTYSGTTAVNGGTLRFASPTALPGGIGATGGTSGLTITGGTVELAAGDFQRNLGTGSSQFQITGGVSGFSALNDPRSITVNGDATQELQWGSATFRPTTLVLNSSVANNSLELANLIDLNAATRTVAVNANKALLSGDIRTASGTAGLTKTGNGTLVLTGNNTYNGSTTINAGTLSVEAASNFGSSSSGLIMGNGATLQIRGTTLTSISGLGHTVTLSSNQGKGFDIQNAANTFTVDQVLNQGSGTLTKSGAGTLVLNQNNTFTGATTAAGGGTLVLDYTTNNGSKLSDSGSFTLNDVNLVLKGGSHNELVGSATVFSNGNSISRDGGTSTIGLGALTLPTNTTTQFYTLAISEPGIATTTTGNASSGIFFLGRVTVGSHFGANDGSGNIAQYAGYTDYTPATASGGSLSVVNQLTGGGTMAGNLSSYGLRIVNSGSSDVLSLGSNNLSVANAGVLLYAGGFDDQYTINGTGRVGTTSSNQHFYVNVSAGTLTVNALLAADSSSTLIKWGAGTLVAGGTNDYTNATYIQQGVLRLTNADALGTTAGGTFVQAGSALELANNITVGAEALTLDGGGIAHGGALRNVTGSNTYGGAITIGASGARISADAGSSLSLTGGIATTLTQDVTFGGAGSTTVSTAGISGSGNLIKDDIGTLILSGANTYTGDTIVSGGTLFVNNASGSGTGVGRVTVGAGGVLGGTGSIMGDIAFDAASFLNVVDLGDALALDGTVTFGEGFGIANLTGLDWGAIALDTPHSLLSTSQSFTSGDIDNFGVANAAPVGSGRFAYFTNGSLAVVVIVPEPGVNAMLAAGGAIGLGLGLLRRRRRAVRLD